MATGSYAEIPARMLITPGEQYTEKQTTFKRPFSGRNWAAGA